MLTMLYFAWCIQSDQSVKTAFDSALNTGYYLTWAEFILGCICLVVCFTIACMSKDEENRSYLSKVCGKWLILVPFTLLTNLAGLMLLRKSGMVDPILLGSGVILFLTSTFRYTQQVTKD